LIFQWGYGRVDLTEVRTGSKKGGGSRDLAERTRYHRFSGAKERNSGAVDNYLGRSTFWKKAKERLG